MVSERSLEVLRVIVQDYVASREPVGSKSIVERHSFGVSAATIRNDMALLEEEQLIAAPHTSSGRVPTDKGYRLFVDRLGQVKPLSVAERRAIETFMVGALDVDDLIARTVRTLAQITRQVAIVQYPMLTGASVRHIELVRLSPGRGLLIVVNSTGQVDQHPVDLGEADEAQVADLRGRLNAALLDSPASTIAARIARLGGQLPPYLNDLAGRVLPALTELSTQPHTTRVVVGGVPNLTRFADEFETAVRPVLEALEEQVVLLKLLGEVASAGDVVVRIGQENSYEPLRSTSVVASGYGIGADQRANLGVVGPTRMDYPSTMAAVRAVARYLSRYLEQG